MHSAISTTITVVRRVLKIGVGRPEPLKSPFSRVNWLSQIESHLGVVKTKRIVKNHALKPWPFGSSMNCKQMLVHTIYDPNITQICVQCNKPLNIATIHQIDSSQWKSNSRITQSHYIHTYIFIYFHKQLIIIIF